MSKMAWKPDENGVPMCEGKKCPFQGFDPLHCKHPDSKDVEYFQHLSGYCYPKMVKIVAALKMLNHAAGNAIPSDCDEMEVALNATKEALKL